MRDGFGRAALILQRRPAAPYREAILDACLRDERYDGQMEGGRAEYLLNLVGLSGDPGWYRERILGALRVPFDPEDDDAYGAQELALDLALRLALEGDAEAAAAIRARFEASAGQELVIGAEQLVAIDGVPGLLFVAERLGAVGWTDAAPDELWFADFLVGLVTEYAGGREAVECALDAAAHDSPGVAAFARAVHTYCSQSDVRGCDRRRGLDLRYEELRRLIADPATSLRRGYLIQPGPDGDERRVSVAAWGRRASDGDFRRAASDLLLQEDRDMLLAYLHIFQGMVHPEPRTFPLSIDGLLELSTSDDDEIAGAALQALAPVTDTRVRELALRLLVLPRVPGGRPDHVVALLIPNYLEGDHVLIERALFEQTDDDLLHWMGMDVQRVFAENPTPDARDLLVLLYEGGRCTFCRTDTISLLHRLRVLPERVLEECLHDASPDTREMARAIRAGTYAHEEE